MGKYSDELDRIGDRWFSDQSTKGSQDLSRLIRSVIGFSADAASTLRTGAFYSTMMTNDFASDHVIELWGAEVGIPRYAGISMDTYKENLLDAWNVWARAGTPRGIEQQANLMPFPARVDMSGEYLDDVTYTPIASNPSQYNLIIKATVEYVKWDNIVWGSFDWGELLAGSTPTTEMIQSYKDICNIFNHIQWVPRDIVVVDESGTETFRYQIRD